MTRSLSNLYKFYNTSASAENVRMIDYNSLVEKKLAELAKQQDAGSEPEGCPSESERGSGNHSK